MKKKNSFSGMGRTCKIVCFSFYIWSSLQTKHSLSSSFLFDLLPALSCTSSIPNPDRVKTFFVCLLMIDTIGRVYFNGNKHFSMFILTRSIFVQGQGIDLICLCGIIILSPYYTYGESLVQAKIMVITADSHVAYWDGGSHCILLCGKPRFW